MSSREVVEAWCNFKGQAYGFDPVTDLEGAYECTAPCEMRIRDGRTLVVLEKTPGEFPVTEVSMCGLPQCRFTTKIG